MLVQFLLSATLITICIDISQAVVYGGGLQLLGDENELYVEIDYDTEEVIIDFIGQDLTWNGVGFGNSVMLDTYAIIMDDDELGGIVFEIILGDHEPGTALQNGLTVLTDEGIDGAIGGRRRVVVSRPLESSEYSFPYPLTDGTELAIPIIAAIGRESGILLDGNGHRTKEAQTLVLSQLVIDPASPNSTISFMETTSDPVDIVTTMATDEPRDTTTDIPVGPTGTVISSTLEPDPCCECTEAAGWNSGCSNTDCSDLICEVDPYCCYSVWDAVCAVKADAVCQGTDVPKCCACAGMDSAWEQGCSADAECETEVCEYDPWCCGGDYYGKGWWDKRCSNKAWKICVNDNYEPPEKTYGWKNYWKNNWDNQWGTSDD